MATQTPASTPFSGSPQRARSGTALSSQSNGVKSSSKASRLSLQRGEPGTKVVDIYDVQKSAAVLLYTLHEALSLTNPTEPNDSNATNDQHQHDRRLLNVHLRDHLAMKIREVVSDFGFTAGIDEQHGRAEARKLVANWTLGQDMTNLKAEYVDMGKKLEAFESSVADLVVAGRDNEEGGAFFNVVLSGNDLDGTLLGGAGVPKTRSTRSGRSNKRSRELDELMDSHERCGKYIKAMVEKKKES